MTTEKKDEKESKIENILDRLLGLPEKMLDKFLEMSLLKQLIYGYLIMQFVIYLQKKINEFKINKGRANY